jgi:hypothetical protein
MYGHLREHIGAFGPAEVRILVSAFDKAWEYILASGAKFETGAHAESARATLAKHIIEAAKQGELDQGRLRDGALVAWAQSNLRSSPLANGRKMSSIDRKCVSESPEAAKQYIPSTHPLVNRPKLA